MTRTVPRGVDVYQLIKQGTRYFCDVLATEWRQTYQAGCPQVHSPLVLQHPCGQDEVEFLGHQPAVYKHQTAVTMLLVSAT